MTHRMREDKRRRALHNIFEAGIFLKGIDGILEIIGGVLLLAVKPESVDRLVIFLTQNELSRDPDDAIANYLVTASRHLSLGARHFGFFYLVSHGIVKMFIVISLLKNRLWAYPGALILFMLFIMYQIYRYSYSHSIWLILLTVFDAAVVFLTWSEYRYLRDGDGS